MAIHNFTLHSSFERYKDIPTCMCFNSELDSLLCSYSLVKTDWSKKKAEKEHCAWFKNQANPLMHFKLLRYCCDTR